GPGADAQALDALERSGADPLIVDLEAQRAAPSRARTPSEWAALTRAQPLRDDILRGRENQERMVSRRRTSKTKQCAAPDARASRLFPRSARRWCERGREQAARGLCLGVAVRGL